MGEFQSRFADALRRRLFPNGTLRLKEIAAAVGRSENTVARWWHGETRIVGEDLQRLAVFLRRRGDPAFLSDVFADALPPGTSPGRREILMQELIQTILEERDGGALPAERHNWIITDGRLELAPAGHGEYVRRALKLPATDGDVIGYATRLLGWIAVTERTDGVVIIRHDARRVSPLAAERACEWLEDRDAIASRVKRIVQIDGSWIETEHSGPRAAAYAIGKLAFIVRVPHIPWRLTRLSFDKIKDARQSDLLRMYHEAPSSIIHAAAELGAFTSSSVFRVEDENVISQHVATGFGFNTRVVEGLNVLARPDTDYALMLQTRVLLTKREGATYHELTGMIDDIYVRYLNLSLPEPGAGGRILSATVLLEKEARAA